MIILSIETSCDETALSVIQAEGDASSPSFDVLGNALYSQASTHAEFGGVMPSLAKREHCRNIVPLFKSAMQQAIASAKPDDSMPESATHPKILGITDEEEQAIRAILTKEMDLAEETLQMLRETPVIIPDCIAVTEGPGLEPALWVGINFAKALSVAFGKPIVPVNHMEGHILSVLLDPAAPKDSSTVTAVAFPALALLISGGHTELVEASAWHEYRVLGQTQDDAIGEAFDKVARLLGLAYPGGPKISILAAESRASGLMTQMTGTAGGIRPWTLPRPMLKSPDFHFSFSGIKTAVLYAVRQKTGADTHAEQSAMKSRAATGNTEAVRSLSDDERKTLAEEFENAVTEVLVQKTKRALKATNARTLVIGGGVVANTYIRAAFQEMISESFGKGSEQPVSLHVPSANMSTDNSVMIGAAGYLRWLHASKLPDSAGLHHPGSIGHADMKARGNLSL